MRVAVHSWAGVSVSRINTLFSSSPPSRFPCLIQTLPASPNGLLGSVFSRDVVRANRLAKQIYSGMTVVNDFAVNYMVQGLPFGGVKFSGFDRFAGPEGLRGVCLMKSFVTDM